MDAFTPDRTLDLSGLKCPLPALRTEKALRGLAPGTRLAVISTDPLAALDIPHLVNQTGHRLAEMRRGENGAAVFLIEVLPPAIRPAAHD
ncbi:sulfurtransferase TusA family protein [Antarcticirhabdus aurantiaca]|uniref:Sulfurtransferase TusA family protein n=1 Tax=Antarcticirhabdus aurantiaca TaxID=2606717 RepID=A0ACD4NI17_9HYPH|nr:sulfurtransferase TusA family protein [Antarcticirhabdus aurantiaca]WAJ26421.1 sulfurtransferase TusA family protein [Jeongeuplla avenae]